MSGKKLRSALTFARRGVAGLLIAGLLSSYAYAGFIGSVVTLEFETGSDSATYEVVVPYTGDPFEWKLESPISIFGGTEDVLLGTIKDLDIGLNGDPSVALSFNVTANAAPTHITITSSTVTFASIVNATAFASAAITVTDLDSSPDGATATGLFPGSKSFQAMYNGTSVFANLVSPVSAAPDSSNTASERFPPVGTLIIGGPTNSINSVFDFWLTANDSASGTSRFNVVPEPASCTLLLLGGAMVLWLNARRKSRR